MNRNRSWHSLDRRIWSGAFGEKQLRDYEKQMGVLRQQLMDHFSASASGDSLVYLTRWLLSYSLDIMSDLAMGTPLHVMDRADRKCIISTLAESFSLLKLQPAA